MTQEFQETTVGQSKEMPARIVIYAEPKIGKTTFAAEAEDVFFINLEGGTSYLKNKVRSTPVLNSYDEVISWLKHIYEDDAFTCGTIAVDSLDWLETLAQDRIVKLHGAKSITDPSVKDFAYFKGVMSAADDAIKVLKWLNAIYEKKGIKCILIAHSQVKNVDLPNQDPYQRHELKLSKWFAAKVNEWCDLVLYAGLDFYVNKEGKTSDAKRVIFGGGNPSFVGGGRMPISSKIDLSYEALKEELLK
jgi:hypothetical protein